MPLLSLSPPQLKMDSDGRLGFMHGPTFIPALHISCSVWEGIASLLSSKDPRQQQLCVAYDPRSLPTGTHGVCSSLVPCMPSPDLPLSSYTYTQNGIGIMGAPHSSRKAVEARLVHGGRGGTRTSCCTTAWQIDGVWQLLQPGLSADRRLQVAWAFNSALLLLGFAFLFGLCLTFPSRELAAGSERELEADWDAALLAYVLSLIQSLVVLDGAKVLIITVVSPQWIPAGTDSSARATTCARWCLRGALGAVAALLVY